MPTRLADGLGLRDVLFYNNPKKIVKIRPEYGSPVSDLLCKTYVVKIHPVKKCGIRLTYSILIFSKDNIFFRKLPESKDQQIKLRTK
jgi:hypothetical protein